MNLGIRIAIYIVLLAAASMFGTLFFQEYNRLMNQPEDGSSANLTDIQLPENASVQIMDEPESRIGIIGGCFFGTMIILGLIAGHDVSHYFGQKASRLIWHENERAAANRDYEAAEEKWADGDYLEAIRLFREYLAKNPREQHAALRIAEIYEKDMQNYLAAALEYEEVLKHKLPRQRWGWAAIHLCNLYYRLGKPDVATALLRRIDSEYGDTAAADKARKRLALIESGEIDPTSESAVNEEPPS